MHCTSISIPLNRNPNASTKSFLKIPWSLVSKSSPSLGPITLFLRLIYFEGHYTALQASPQSTNTFTTNPDLSISVTVDEVFDNDHRVVNTKTTHTGKFTFSAADSGDHRICFHVLGAGSGGWLSGGQNNGAVKLTLDLAIGETNAIKNADEGKVGELAQKVRDLNGRLMDIRREQVFQRVSLLRAI